MVYALGGGRGHATRGSLLALALLRAGIPARVLVRDRRIPAAFKVPAVECPGPLSSHALRDVVRRMCDRWAVTDLVIDTFPDGLLGELRAWTGGPRRHAILRCRKDGHHASFLRTLERVDAAWDLEPHLEWLPEHVNAEPLGPLSRFGWATEHLEAFRTVLIVASEPKWRSLLQRLASRLRANGVETKVVTASVASWTPLSRDDVRGSIVVGPAGFNLTYEAYGVGAWHVALPGHRSHDDQHRRAASVALTVHSPDALERLVRRLLDASAARPRPFAMGDIDEWAHAWRTAFSAGVHAP